MKAESDQISTNLPANGMHSTSDARVTALRQSQSPKAESTAGSGELTPSARPGAGARYIALKIRCVFDFARATVACRPESKSMLTTGAQALLSTPFANAG